MRLPTGFFVYPAFRKDDSLYQEVLLVEAFLLTRCRCRPPNHRERLFLPRQEADEMTRFLLVRHGQTAWDRNERFRGQTDVPLDATGLVQAEFTGRYIASAWRPVAVYTSPLGRARATAAAVASPLNLPVQMHPGLNDIDYGQWHGLTVDEARSGWPDALTAWFHDPKDAQPPGGESLVGVQARAMSTVHELAALHPFDTIVLVGHTVVNRVILLDVLGLGLDRFWRLGQDTCAINVFEWTENEFFLRSLNMTCHLEVSPLA